MSLSKEEWAKVFGQPNDSVEEQHRLAAYKEALEDAWKHQPCKETQDRLNGYIKINRLARLKWIDWVEERAQLGSPPWCMELVGSAIARKLGA